MHTPMLLPQPLPPQPFKRHTPNRIPPIRVNHTLKPQMLHHHRIQTEPFHTIIPSILLDPDIVVPGHVVRRQRVVDTLYMRPAVNHGLRTASEVLISKAWGWREDGGFSGGEEEDYEGGYGERAEDEDEVICSEIEFPASFSSGQGAESEDTASYAQTCEDADQRNVVPEYLLVRESTCSLLVEDT